MSMRLFLIAASAGILASCATSSASEKSIRRETVRLERESGELTLKAGTYANESAFVFRIGYANSASELGAPTDVSWTVNFLNYCRDRPSWVESVLVGPTGEVWRGYRVAVPAGPVRTQDWSSGADGAERYGGPPTPGLLNAIKAGGQFTLALEDDAGVRHNAVVIDSLTPSERETLFQATSPEDRRNQPIPLQVVPIKASAPSSTTTKCPDG
jgi:hypothetical protein